MSNDDMIAAAAASVPVEAPPAEISAIAEQSSSTAASTLDVAADAGAGEGARTEHARAPSEVPMDMDMEIDSPLDNSSANTIEQAQQPPQQQVEEPSIAAALEAPVEAPNSTLAQEVAGGEEVQQDAQKAATSSEQKLLQDGAEKPTKMVVEPEHEVAALPDAAPVSAPEPEPAPAPASAPESATEAAPEFAPEPRPEAAREPAPELMSEPQALTAQQQLPIHEEGQLPDTVAAADASVPEPSPANPGVQDFHADAQEASNAEAGQILPESAGTTQAPAATSEHNADADPAALQGLIDTSETQAEQQAAEVQAKQQEERLAVGDALTASVQDSTAPEESQVRAEPETAGNQAEHEQVADEVPSLERRLDGDVEMTSVDAQSDGQQISIQLETKEGQREAEQPAEGTASSEATAVSGLKDSTASEPALPAQVAEVQASEAPQAEGMALDEPPQQEELIGRAPADKIELPPSTFVGNSGPTSRSPALEPERPLVTNGRAEHTEAPPVIKAENGEEAPVGPASSAAPLADTAQPKNSARHDDPKPAAPQKAALPEKKVSPTLTENASKARADRSKEPSRRERDMQRPAATGHEVAPTKEVTPTPQKTREMEQAELQRQRERENEEARLLWLSLPGNDHPSYYSDTDASSHGGCSRASTVSSTELIDRETEPFIPPPAGAGMIGGPHSVSLLHQQAGHLQFHDLDEELEESSMRASLTDPPQHPHSYNVARASASDPALNRKRRVDLISNDKDDSADDLDSDMEEHYQLKKQMMMEMHKYRRGNRGNKLKRSEGARWVRTKKLGPYTEARNEKEVNDRIRVRIAALQRAGIRALLDGAPDPVPKIEDASLNDPLAYMPDDEGPLTSTALASALLRPILTARALLESHTLKHTFRNPHIGALSRTATDLRESESVIGRALGRTLTAMEITTIEAEVKEEAVLREREAARKAAPPLLLPPAADGDSSGDSLRPENDAIPPNPELDPAFARLDKLFVTPGGLPIPLPEPLPPGTDPSSQSHPPPQAILTVAQQQEVVRAALDCLHELSADSKEYVERLDEVRSRLASVKQKRAVVWNAIRVWALARDKKDQGSDAGSESEDADEDDNYPVSLTAAMTAAQEQLVGSTPTRRRGGATATATMAPTSSRAGSSAKRAR